MEEKYKKEIRILLQRMECEDFIRKIYTMTRYYANREVLESIKERAE